MRKIFLGSILILSLLTVACTTYEPITGKAVANTKRCLDTDGENYYTPGKVIYSYTLLGKDAERIYEDNCKNSKLLIEFSCKNDRKYETPFPCDCNRATGACIKESVCNNNILEENEECDGTDFGGLHCEDFDMVSGELQCNSNCEFELSSCKENLKEELVVEPRSSCSDYDFNCDGMTDKADAKIISDMWYDGKTFNMTTVTSQRCKPFSIYLGDIYKRGFNTIPIEDVTRIGAEIEKCKVNCIQAQPRGDVNADGRLDDKDAKLILSIAVGNMDKPQNLCCVDINRDGAVNSADAILVRKGGDLGVCPLPISCLAEKKIGDATGDGVIDWEDSDAIMETSVGSLPMPTSICCADVNKDGKVNSGDALLVQQIIKGTKISPGVCPPTDTKALPPFVLAIADDATSADKDLAYKVLTMLKGKGYTNVSSMIARFSDVDALHIKEQVTLALYDGMAIVLVGPTAPASYVLLSSDLVRYFEANNIKHKTMFTSEITSSDLKALFLIWDTQSCIDGDGGKNYGVRSYGAQYTKGDPVGNITIDTGIIIGNNRLFQLIGMDGANLKVTFVEITNKRKIEVSTVSNIGTLYVDDFTYNFKVDYAAKVVSFEKALTEANIQSVEEDICACTDDNCSKSELKERYCDGNSLTSIMMPCLCDSGVCKVKCLGNKIGDVNGDGTFDQNDVELTLALSVGTLEMPASICCADVDKDGKIDSGDVVLIGKIAEGKMKSPGTCNADTCGDWMCQKGENDYCPLCITSMPPCYNSCTAGTCPKDCRKPSNAICADPDGKGYETKSTAIIYTPSSGTILKAGKSFAVDTDSVVKLYYMDQYRSTLRFYLFNKEKYIDVPIVNGAGTLNIGGVYPFYVDYNKKQITLDRTVTLAEITKSVTDQCIYLNATQTKSALVEAYCGVGILKELVECNCMNGACTGGTK